MIIGRHACARQAGCNMPAQYFQRSKSQCTASKVCDNLHLIQDILCTSQALHDYISDVYMHVTCFVCLDIVVKPHKYCNLQGACRAVVRPNVFLIVHHVMFCTLSVLTFQPK